MKILIVGDIVGSPGRAVFTREVKRMREEGTVDFVVANAENAAGGRGIIPRLCDELYEAGADLLTLGDHAWDQKDLIPRINEDKRIIRPANFAPGCPGRGWITMDTPETKITIVNLVGRVFMQATDCPFRKIDEILDRPAAELGKVILVDFHAEATSEKIAMGWHLDGRVTALTGTHTHVQTSDERILPKGTAYITDLGMTGPKDSVLGRGKESILRRFQTGMPTQFKIATENVVMEGILLNVDHNTGKARGIERIRQPEQ